MAHNYLMKYKGQYRILPELDKSTNDIPRDINGNIDNTYDDIYIACQHGNKIFSYGHFDKSKTVWLMAYIPSLGRGRNIKKEIDEKSIPIKWYTEGDGEVSFLFEAKYIDVMCTLLKAKTFGANISPFSSKNLPKNKEVDIPTEQMQQYKEIISEVKDNDLLMIAKITNSFLVDKLNKKQRKIDKSFDYKIDIKKMCLSRQKKEYIYVKDMWDEYLSYLKKEIKKNYKGE